MYYSFFGTVYWRLDGGSLTALCGAAEYMALPASQYSVLDAQRIERIDDNTFCCYVEGVKFFGIRVEPVLTVAVVVGPKGPTVKLLSTVVSATLYTVCLS